MTAFTIDGRAFDVQVLTGIQRQARILDRDSSGRVQSGDMKRNIIGTYFNYSLQIETSKLNLREYDALYEILTDPVESHSFTLPYAQSTITFDAYVANIDDILTRMTDTGNYWTGMTINLIAISAYKKGNGEAT